MVNVETLLYIVENGKVLLIKKKRGLGAGLYNGIGGKVEEGEVPLQAVIRECIEEIGAEPLEIEWVGLLEFYNDGVLYGFVHVFKARGLKGEPRESEEAAPMWFEIDKIPYDKMWEDDKFWLPLVLEEGKKVYGRFYFLNNWSRLTKSEIYTIESEKIITSS
ncbi:MAG: 8-oxo-dGTP diphosphatase [Candidatus Korarchaeota archaeon]|nr:8-oxo-dGTP diphosphatase [Thermoproteota archaeon]MCR8501679.1 8-oxo-dGTP diphosphatase [Thermoproteota archaeon]